MRYRLCKLPAISLRYEFSVNRRLLIIVVNRMHAGILKRFITIFLGNPSKTTNRQNRTETRTIFLKQETMRNRNRGGTILLVQLTL